MNKAKMEREGTLPRKIAASQDANDTLEEWNEVNNNHAGGNNGELVVPTPGGLPAIRVKAPFVEDNDSSVGWLESKGLMSWLQVSWALTMMMIHMTRPVPTVIGHSVLQMQGILLRFNGADMKGKQVSVELLLFVASA
jgi:hypothetical protein